MYVMYEWMKPAAQLCLWEVCLQGTDMLPGSCCWSLGGGNKWIHSYGMVVLLHSSNNCTCMLSMHACSCRSCRACDHICNAHVSAVQLPLEAYEGELSQEVITAEITDIWLYHGLQVDVAGEWDG